MKNGKRDGMERAERHADPHWKQCWLEDGRIVALRKPYFYTADIKKLMRENHPNASTHEKRAIGPMMRQMARLGYCEKSKGGWVPSTEPQCHGRPCQVWVSLIYRGVPIRRPYYPPPLDPRELPEAPL